MKKKQNDPLIKYTKNWIKNNTLSTITKKKEKRKTCNPQPIMRLTALLPPPPTPTTLILALSIDSNEHVTGFKRRRRGFLGFSEIQFLRVVWEIGVGIEEDESSLLGFCRENIDIFLLCIRVLELELGI